MINFLKILELINYGLVTTYGFLLSIAFSGGYKSIKQKNLSIYLLVIFILIQTPLRFIMGVDFTKQIYPIIVHLPLVLVLVFALKKPVGVSIVSVFTAYSCCQLPRMVSIIVLFITSSPLISEILYTLAIVPIFILLYKYFAKFAYTTMTYSRNSLFLFGILPTAYYIFDFATTIYTKLLYSGIYAINEALPTVCIIFYIGFITLYHADVQKINKAEFEKSALSLELKQAETEITAMKIMREQNAVFRHDLRHHINLLSAYLENNDVKSATDYIKQMNTDIDKITPTLYSENNIVNFTLSYFKFKAKEKGVKLNCEVNVPQEINILETDLSAVLSNTIENAINAATCCDNSIDKTVNVNLQVKKNKLLISVKNPYTGLIEVKDELPTNIADGHGFGIKSIKTIVEHHNGIYSFDWDNNTFKTRIVMNI